MVRISPIQTVLNASALNSLLVFPVSLTYPLLRHNNFIGFSSPLALDLKFFFLFLILNSALLLNTFVMITSLPLLSLPALSILPIAMIFFFHVLGQLWSIESIGPSIRP